MAKFNRIFLFISDDPKFVSLFFQIDPKSRKSSYKLTQFESFG